MKRSKIHIFCSRILLICFVVGQLLVYAHQHKTYNTNNSFASTTKQSVKEKCSICDVMQHNNMVVGNNPIFYSDYIAIHIFPIFTYNFKSLSLILSCGRAPPGSVISIA